MALKDLLKNAAPSFNEVAVAEQYILALQEISVDLPDKSYRKEEIRQFLEEYAPSVKHVKTLGQIYAGEERIREIMKGK